MASCRVLTLYREVIALRRETPALHRGSYETLPAQPGVWAFERRHGDQRVRIALSFESEPRHVALGPGTICGGLRTTPDLALPSDSADIELGPYEGTVLILG